MREPAAGRLLGARAKIVLLACLSVAVLLVDSIMVLAALDLVLLAVFASARLGWKRFAILVLFAAATVWGFVLTQSLFYPYRPRTLMLELVPPGAPLLGPLTGGVALYWEGAVYGLQQSLRFLALLVLGLTVVWTTSPQRLLLGLRRLRLPYRLAFMVAAALRFLPAIAEEARTVVTAMRVRGYRLRPARPWRYLAALGHGLAPILFRNIRRATMLADSVESRSFAAAASTPSAATAGAAPSGAADRLVCLAVPAATLLLVGAKLLHLAALSGLFYSDALAWLYGLADAIL